MAEQQARIGQLFVSIENEFDAFDGITNLQQAESKLSYVTGLIREVKTVIKEYDREARVDGIPVDEILAAKARYVNQVNGFVARKKNAAARLKDGKDRAAAAPASAAPTGAPASVSSKPGIGSRSMAESGTAGPSPGVQAQAQIQDMDNQELVGFGRQRMNETDAELERGRRIVTETEEVGAKAAADLKRQTEQMGRVVDDLNEIEFSMQRASRVIRDITRGLATDKCIMCLIFLVVAAIVVAVVLKITGVGDDAVNLPGPQDNGGGGGGGGDGDGGDASASPPSRKLLGFPSSWPGNEW